MSKVDSVRPVSSIKHNDKRAAIPDSTHQGEEQMACTSPLTLEEQMACTSPLTLPVTHCSMDSTTIE